MIDWLSSTKDQSHRVNKYFSLIYLPPQAENVALAGLNTCDTRLLLFLVNIESYESCSVIGQISEFSWKSSVSDVIWILTKTLSLHQSKQHIHQIWCPSNLRSLPFSNISQIFHFQFPLPGPRIEWMFWEAIVGHHTSSSLIRILR